VPGAIIAWVVIDPTVRSAVWISILLVLLASGHAVIVRQHLRRQGLRRPRTDRRRVPRLRVKTIAGGERSTRASGP
jgi:hypothetical protein